MLNPLSLGGQGSVPRSGEALPRGRGGLPGGRKETFLKRFVEVGEASNSSPG